MQPLCHNALELMWKRRNLMLWQQVDETTTQVAECAKQVLDDWILAQL